ncbi:tagaturonate reductase [Latilactobacillus sp. 5-91]|uniref:tagaturonate reductase n=1 Tax=Latilactobacillus sp. 5-91 TaxID=3410924 RepID=UPI003C762B7A
MQNIKAVIKRKKELPTKVLQFGEGNFLRAFVDWQIQQMNNQGLFNGGVKVIQPIEHGMVDRLADQDNLYTVLLEGLLAGEKIQSSEVITAINGTVNPYADFAAYLDLAQDDNLAFIFSNTTEAGIQFDPTDQLTTSTPNTYPGKLTALLYERFKLQKPGFDIIPCELINHNGDQLKDCVLKYADLWALGAAFKQWVNTENRFYSTLVDRIVPGYPKERAAELCEQFGYQDDLIVKAEPFLIFVIEGDASLAERLPLKAAGINVVITDNMQPYRERKVRLLNGPHSTMAPIARLAGLETVGQVMADPDFSQFINDEMYTEIMPVIDLPHQELADYAEGIKERFANPYVKHELASIALNSISKFKARLLPSLQQNIEQQHQVPVRMALALAALLVIYGDYPDIAIEPNDTPETIAFFKTIQQQPDYIEKALATEALWGMDLTQLPGLEATVKADMAQILNQQTRQLVRAINKGETL